MSCSWPFLPAFLAVKAPRHIVNADCGTRRYEDAEAEPPDPVDMQFRKDPVDRRSRKPSAPLNEPGHGEDREEAGEAGEQQPILDIGKFLLYSGLPVIRGKMK